jgi:hypothetical protein
MTPVSGVFLPKKIHLRWLARVLHLGGWISSTLFAEPLQSSVFGFVPIKRNNPQG